MSTQGNRHPYSFGTVHFREDAPAWSPSDLVPGAGAGDDLMRLHSKAATLADIVLSHGSVAEALGSLTDESKTRLLTAEDIALNALPDAARHQYAAFRAGNRVPPLDWAAIQHVHASGSDGGALDAFRKRHTADVLAAKVEALRTVYADVDVEQGDGEPPLQIGVEHVMAFESEYEVLCPLLDAVAKVRMLQTGQREPDGRLNERMLAEKRECDRVCDTFQRLVDDIWKQASKIRAEIHENLSLIRARSRALDTYRPSLLSRAAGRGGDAESADAIEPFLPRASNAYAGSAVSASGGGADDAPLATAPEHRTQSSDAGDDGAGAEQRSDDAAEHNMSDPADGGADDDDEDRQGRSKKVVSFSSPPARQIPARPTPEGSEDSDDGPAPRLAKRHRQEQEQVEADEESESDDDASPGADDPRKKSRSDSHGSNNGELTFEDARDEAMGETDPDDEAEDEQESDDEADHSRELESSLPSDDTEPAQRPADESAQRTSRADEKEDEQLARSRQSSAGAEDAQQQHTPLLMVTELAPTPQGDEDLSALRLSSPFQFAPPELETARRSRGGNQPISSISRIARLCTSEDSNERGQRAPRFANILPRPGPRPFIRQ